MDRTEEMTAFVRIARSGSITAAAVQLKLAKSALSRRLAALEERLGVQLLIRTTRSMTLTDAGAQFLERAEEILQAMDAAEAEAASTSGRLSGRLRVAAPLTFGLLHLNPLVREFARAHPDLELALDFSDRQVDLANDGFDVGIRIADLSESNLAARPLTLIRHVVCASPGYLARHGTPTHPDELAGHRGLDYTNTAADWAWTAADGKAGRVRPRSAMAANNGEFLKEAGIDGVGIALQPSFIVHDALADGRLVQLLPDYRWRTLRAYAVYPRTRYLPVRVRGFIDFLSARFDPEAPYWDRGLAYPELR